MLLPFVHPVSCCCTMFETDQTFEPTTPNLSFVQWSPKRSATMLDPFAQVFTFSSPEPRIDPRLWETLCAITCAVAFLCLLTPGANMNAPIRDAFDCSSRKPMRRHFVSGFSRALPFLSQEKSSGVEIELFQHRWGHARALHNYGLHGDSNAWTCWKQDGSYPSHNTLRVLTLLGVFAFVCTQLPTTSNICKTNNS